MTHRDAMITHILEELCGDDQSSASDLMRTKLIQQSDRTLSLILPILELHQAGEHQYKFLYSVLGDRKRNEFVLNETLFFRPRFEMFTDHHLLIETTQGLRHYSRFKNCIALDELTGTDLAIATALVNVTAYISEHMPRESVIDRYDEGSNHYIRFIKSVPLANLIIKHYDKTEMITRFMDERNTTDPALLRSYIENRTPLNEGVL